MDRNTIIPAVYLILEQNSKVLFLKRINTGYRDGEYSLVSGHVESGESILNSIIREASEEAGIAVSAGDLKLVHVLSRVGDKDGEERIDFFWHCTKWFGEVQNMEPQKMFRVKMVWC